ncbi:MAG: glycosyltransferase [Candidatus Omnitrophica bacterium]|nr:glycosyltransferase [Candidatus Omnitrophota bacterium]
MEEPKPTWAREVQTEPPNFGQAQRVSSLALWWEVARRRPRCEAILAQGQALCPFVPGLVSLVVLSCRRLPQLQRLCDSLIPFLGSVETFSKFERILVDNGSGQELLAYAKSLNFFHRIMAHQTNRGMLDALRGAFTVCRGEYILLLEEDFVLQYDRPFLRACLDVLTDYPEIGIIRLKNQNNWWKPHRRIAPLRSTRSGVPFWTWLPSADGTLNVWSAGSVLFRKVSYVSTGPLPEGPNVSRETISHQGYLYECSYGRRYNRTWLAAKLKQCYPFVQPNDHADSPGWGQETTPQNHRENATEAQKMQAPGFGV